MQMHESQRIVHRYSARRLASDAHICTIHVHLLPPDLAQDLLYQDYPHLVKGNSHETSHRDHQAVQA